MSIEMSELHRNEKYYYMPTNSEKVSSVKTGDIMLFGSDCLVLFYEDFKTSYSYTRLGYIEDKIGLADALGNGSVKVSFRIAIRGEYCLNSLMRLI